ncbi:hypothetical protein OG241_33040 [Streptomyces sp. NBC_01390]|uniref:hypothetical protein n=1 Tax=Streptomyces sp. NBC_01390 TaxID=2903850 RepID=UPI00324E3761
MNLGSPLAALFPGTSGRLLTALVGYHSADAVGPLPLDELSKNAAVRSAQLEVALFRLGPLGLVAPRRRGPSHTSRARPCRLGLPTPADRPARRCHRHGRQACREPAPDYLAVNGAVVEGTATRPAGVLELIVVPPPTAQADWHGDLVIHRIAQNNEEEEAMGEPNAVRVFLA